MSEVLVYSNNDMRRAWQHIHQLFGGKHPVSLRPNRPRARPDSWFSGFRWRVWGCLRARPGSEVRFSLFGFQVEGVGLPPPQCARQWRSVSKTNPVLLRPNRLRARPGSEFQFSVFGFQMECVGFSVLEFSVLGFLGFRVAGGGCGVASPAVRATVAMSARNALANETRPCFRVSGFRV